MQYKVGGGGGGGGGGHAWGSVIVAIPRGILWARVCVGILCVGLGGGGGAGQASSSPVFVEPERGKSYSLKTETKILARPD